MFVIGIININIYSFCIFFDWIIFDAIIIWYVWIIFEINSFYFFIISKRIFMPRRICFRIIIKFILFFNAIYFWPTMRDSIWIIFSFIVIVNIFFIWFIFCNTIALTIYFLINTIIIILNKLLIKIIFINFLF